MIPTQTLETFPVFGDNATKVQPDNGGAKYSNGFQQSDVLPAEWLNWEWNKASSAVTALNSGVNSVESELNNVLNEAGISPSGSATNQVYKAVRKNSGCIMASSRTITGAPAIEAGNTIKIMFTADITGSNLSDGMTITYNGTSYPVVVNKLGVLINFTAKEIYTDFFRYIQANTIIDFVFDGVQFVIIGNPIIWSLYDNIQVFANGFVSGPPIGTLVHLYENVVPYGYLLCDGSTFDQNKYPGLYAFLGSTLLPDYRECAIVGAGQNTKDSMSIHDVFNVGEFKGDQLQDHSHGILNTTSGSVDQVSIGLNPSTPGSNGGCVVMSNVNYESRYSSLWVGKIGGYFGGNAGTVTRGKRKGALICIKAL